MKNKAVVHIRGFHCPPKIEEKFNTWYNEVHIPMLFKFKGMKKAARFKRVGNDGQYPNYLTIYEFQDLKSFEEYKRSPEFLIASEESRTSWPSGGYKRKWNVQFELIKSWVKKSTPSHSSRRERS